MIPNARPQQYPFGLDKDEPIPMFSSSPSYSFASSQSQAQSGNVRKFKKGIDLEQERRGRTEKAIQIRKDKRTDRTNLVRKFAKIDKKEASLSEGADNGNTSFFRGPGLKFFQEKCRELNSTDSQLKINATVYLRRILSSGKVLPLDLLFEQPHVVHNLCEFLLEQELPLLQREAAWCLTNIACGDSQFIAILLQHHAITNLSHTIMHFSDDKVLLHQCIWVVCNMSADEQACQAIIEDPALFILLMAQVGVECVQDPANFTSWVALQDSLTPIRIPMKDNPTLSLMRHVTFILGNILKLRLIYPSCVYKCLLFALADLVQSPDDEILIDIAQTIYILVSQLPQVVDFVLELGFLTRFRELFEASTSPNSSSLRELSLATICALIRSSAPCQRRMLLVRMNLSWSAKPFIQVLIEFLGELTLSSRDVEETSGIMDDGHTNTNYNNSNNNNKDVGSSSKSTIGKTIVTVSSSETKRDILSALRAILSLPEAPQRRFVTVSEVSRIQTMYNQGLLVNLHMLVSQSAFDVKVDAGHLFLDMIIGMDFQLSVKDLHLALQVLENLIVVSDGALVSRALNALESIFSLMWTQYQYGHLSDEVREVVYHHSQGDFGRALEIVCLRPHDYQSTVAEEIMEMLEKLTQTS